MQDFTIVRKSKVEPTFRNSAVCGKFDIPFTEEKEFRLSARLDIPDTWNIGVIHGSSGSGKSLLASEIGEGITRNFQWDNSKSLVDNFPEKLSFEEISSYLSAVGLNSVPVWLQPYKTLSNGQQHRADLAILLASNDVIVFDEFTSVVDRIVAKSISKSISKFIKKSDKKFIAVTCHSDIVEWLEPDWTFETDTGRFARDCLRRPSIEITITEGSTDYWKYFAKNHYMTGDISHAAKVFLCWANIDETQSLVGFFSIIAVMGMKGWRRGHRTVVLPDYQGLGIGNRMIESVAEWLYNEKGLRFRATTSSVPLIKHRIRNPHMWRCTLKPRMNAPSLNKKQKVKTSAGRLTSTWVYIPEKLRQ